MQLVEHRCERPGQPAYRGRGQDELSPWVVLAHEHIAANCDLDLDLRATLESRSLTVGLQKPNMHGFDGGLER